MAQNMIDLNGSLYYNIKGTNIISAYKIPILTIG